MKTDVSHYIIVSVIVLGEAVSSYVIYLDLSISTTTGNLVTIRLEGNCVNYTYMVRKHLNAITAYAVPYTYSAIVRS